MNDNNTDLFDTLVSTIAKIDPAAFAASNTVPAITIPPTPQKREVTLDCLLEERELNRVSVDYKMTEHELMKLKESAPDYASEIKEKISREVARDIIKKVSFTKKKVDDTNHFIGRVWVFSDEELKTLLEKFVNV